MTLELYPVSAHNAFHGSGMQYPCEIDEAVQHIYGACKGLGTDEKTLITVLGSKSPETRNLIALRYKELYQKPLKSLLKSETSGDFGRLLRMISMPLPETEAQILRDATKRMGTTESLIVQILSGRTNEEMSILKRTYFDLVGKDLAVTLNSELSGDFRKVVMAVLQSSQVPYNPAVHNAAKAEEEAIALYKAGQGRLGTNEEVFIGILVKAPPEFLKMMDAVYVAKYNNNIVKAVDKEFSGDAKKSLNYMVRSTLDPYPAIAEVFEKTMKGFGTDETGLSTALVRYQSVLPHVKAAYKRQYHEELRDRISGETSGDYKKLLLEVFDAPHDPPKSKAAASSTGFGAVPTGASSPAYLSSQTSYASSSTSLGSHAQGYSASQAYATPAGQQSYGQSSQATLAQTPYGAGPQQTPTSQPGGYSSQTPTSQPGGYSSQTPTSHAAGYSSGSSYPSQDPAQSQAPGYPAPGYPSPQQQQYAASGHQASSQSYPQHNAPQQQPPNQPYQQYPPGQQQQPPSQQHPQYPAPGGQSQSYQQYGAPQGQHQQPTSQPYQYPVPGQPPSQPYQQYPVHGQQQPPSQPYQQYPAPGGHQQPYQQYGAPPGQQQQPPSHQHQQYPPPGQQPSNQPYQQYAATGQQPPTQPYQQYPAPGAPPQQPGYPPGQPQPYQQYGAPHGQPGYPAPCGTATPPPQQHGGYPPPNQPQYPNPSGYPSYRGV